ncbi:MAG: outer membrane protein assembly factor BamD [Alphaproteobacteria bacterium]
MNNRLSILPVLLAAVLLVGCAGDEFVADKQSAEELHSMAMHAMDAGQFERAANIFDELDRMYPYSELATNAQMMAGYAHYKNLKYTKAIAALETFLQLHPGNKDAPYAQYMLALCYYEQIYNVKRDQKMATYALDAFTELVRRFPSSKYTKDAKYKIDLTRDHLAGKEMDIGRFYLRHGGVVSAINRFRTVVKHYHMTSHVQEALHRLVESFLLLGMKDEAMAAAAVLGHNYPGSEWYADSYLLLQGEDFRLEEHKDDGRSWMKRLLGKRIDG